jgi:hypothetical protein
MISRCSNHIFLAIILFTSATLSWRICAPKGMLTTNNHASFRSPIKMPFIQVFDAKNKLRLEMDCLQAKLEKEYLAMYVYEQIGGGQTFVHTFAYNIKIDGDLKSRVNLDDFLEESNKTMIWYIDCFFTDAEFKNNKYNNSSEFEAYISRAKLANTCKGKSITGAHRLSTNDNERLVKFPSKNRVVSFRFFLYDEPIHYPRFAEFTKSNQNLAKKVETWIMSNPLESIGFHIAIDDALGSKIL